MTAKPLSDLTFTARQTERQLVTAPTQKWRFPACAGLNQALRFYQSLCLVDAAAVGPRNRQLLVAVKLKW